VRRIGSTLPNEHGGKRAWIEKCAVHAHGRSSRSIHKGEYAAQRPHMPQKRANMIDA